jgi:membrane protease YdiL (CAAX protease family)
MNEFLDLARRGKTTWWRYPAAIVLAIVLWLLLCVFGIVAFELAGAVPADISQQLTQPKHIETFYGGTGLLFGGLLVAMAVAVRLLHGKRFSDIVGIWSWRRMAIGAGLWLAVCVVAGGLDYLIQPAGFSATAGAATITLTLWAVPSLTVQTFTEEFIFRGYVTQGLLLATRRPFVAAVLSGLAFAALHIPNGWPQAASAAAFGVITALIAMRTAGIALTFGLHLVNNLFGAVVLVSANDVFRGSPALITQSTPQLQWLDAVAPFVALIAALWLSGRGPRLSPRPS